MTAVSALSNTSQRSVYNYARRPILRTGLRPVQLLLVMTLVDIISINKYALQNIRVAKFAYPTLNSLFIIPAK